MLIGLLLVLFTTHQAIWAAEKCCPNIGCFTDAYPYNSMPLPMCIEEMKPVYTMYTRANKNTGQTLTHNSAIPSIFLASKRTVFIVHGWNNDGNTQWLTDMKNAFLNREDMNVVKVDWGGGSQLSYYPQSASNTRSIGKYTALVINNLENKGGASNTRMWCAGHSLGAHVCGIAGMSTTLQRTTGLDPAGPWFEGVADKKVGINPTSGRFVDIIHTDSVYGTTRDLGHVDFYPNAGHDQPGCNFDTCSHGRAVDFMIESISKDCFSTKSQCSGYTNIPGSCTSCSCNGGVCSKMGYAADVGCKKSGIFYLTTNTRSPFCQG